MQARPVYVAGHLEVAAPHPILIIKSWHSDHVTTLGMASGPEEWDSKCKGWQ